MAKYLYSIVNIYVNHYGIGFRMKNNIKNHPGFWLLLALTIAIYSFTLYNNGLAFPDGTDGFFHLERILSIRDAFLHHELPNWFNFNSFDFSGRAVNAMYPDFTLWILVSLTLFLSPLIQYITIQVLLVWITYFFSYVVFHKKTNKFRSSLLAFMYTTSTVAGDITNNFQPGSIILFALLPMFFMKLFAIFRETTFNLKLSIQMSLIITLIFWSHLWSVIIIFFIALSYLLYCVFNQKLNKVLILYFILIVTNVLIVSAPIIYRIYTISRTHLLPLGSYKDVIYMSLGDIFTNWSWNGDFSTPIILLILVPIIILAIKKISITTYFSCFNSSSETTYLMFLFCFIIICSTDLIPWRLIELTPILSSVQITEYRLIPLLVPITFMVFIEIINSVAFLEIILVLTALIGFSSMIQIVSNDILIGYKNPTFITKNTKSIQLHKRNRTGGTFINYDALYTDKIDVIRDYPDYVPNIIGSNPKNSWIISDFGKNISEHKGFLNANPIHFSLQDISTNKLVFKGINKKGTLLLPVFAYQNIDYKVIVGNQKVPFKTNKGILEIQYNNTNQKISVSYKLPETYIYLVYVAFSYVLLELSILVIYREKK